MAEEAMKAGLSNYDVAFKAEMKKVVRQFIHYTTNQVSTLANKRGRRSRSYYDRGEYRYSHPAVPNISFEKRSAAARYAMAHPDTAVSP